MRTAKTLFTVAVLASISATSALAQQPKPAPPASAVPPLIAATDDITRQVSALRGLSLIKPFARGLLNRDQIIKKLRARIDKEYSPAELAVEARLLKRLGLLPADADYLKMLTDLLEEQVAGFYDPFAKELYVADWLGDDLQRPAMAHEIEHALQDQHFDLKAFASPLKEDGDRQMARSALVEGDGTAVMFEFVVQSMGLDLPPDAVASMSQQLISSQAAAASPALAKAPRFLRDTMTFPYFAGLQFVMAMRKGKQPWSRIDEVFKSPPESTSQILHPAKYLAHERPAQVTATSIDALAPGKELRRDVIGELEWRLLLETELGDAEAERAAAGWGGDRLVAWGDDKDGPVAIVDLSTWDTEDDAVELETAARHWLAKCSKQPEPAADKPAIFTTNNESNALERHGRQVLTMIGVPADKRAAIADEVWKKWKVEATAAVETKPSKKKKASK